eukprot:8689789-Alexandrium_andersonii.AAC.1
MSASLVGSEMCIRDRSPTPGRRSQRPRPRANQVAAALGKRRRLDEPPAVSYTHLTLPTICSV